MNKKQIKTSSIFFGIGIFLLAILIFMFAVPQQQFVAEIDNIGSITANDVSESTIIILFSISALVILIGLIIKLRFEDKRK